MALSQASEYNVAAAILAVSLLVATAVLWVVSIFKCRRRGDPARRGLRWMKLCGPLIGCYLLLFALTCVMEILFVEIGSSFSSDGEDYEYFLPASRFLGAFTHFFVELASAVLLLTLMHLGLGALHAVSPEPSKLRPSALLAAKVAAGVLVVLAIAVLGVSLSYQKDAITYQDEKTKLEGFQDVTVEELNNEALTVRKLSGALTILLFAGAVASVAFAALVFLRVSKTHLKKVALLLLAAAILYFERNLFTVVIMGIYFDFGNLASALDVPPYINILNVIFEAAPLVLLLFVLSWLGKVKEGGLWSEAPTHGQPAPHQPPHWNVYWKGPEGQQPQQGYMGGPGPQFPQPSQGHMSGTVPQGQQPLQGYMMGTMAQGQPPPQGYMGGTAAQGQQTSYAGPVYQYGPQHPVAGGVSTQAPGTSPSPPSPETSAHPTPPQPT